MPAIWVTVYEWLGNLSWTVFTLAGKPRPSLSVELQILVKKT